jgi:hypothetical protein
VFLPKLNEKYEKLLDKVAKLNLPEEQSNSNDVSEASLQANVNLFIDNYFNTVRGPIINQRHISQMKAAQVDEKLPENVVDVKEREVTEDYKQFEADLAEDPHQVVNFEEEVICKEFNDLSVQNNEHCGKLKNIQCLTYQVL